MKKENVLYKGKFKCKVWPILYILLAAAYLALAYILYFQLHFDLIFPLASAVVGIVIFFCGIAIFRAYAKRKLLFGEAALEIKYAKDSIVIPFAEILCVALEKRKLKIYWNDGVILIKGLRRRKTVYNKFLRLLYDWKLKYLSNEQQTEDIAVAATAVDIIAEEPHVAEPQTTMEKLQYNRALYEAGMITYDEMNLRNAALLSIEFPDLYK